MSNEIKKLEVQVAQDEALYQTQLAYHNASDPVMQNIAVRIASNKEKIETLKNENKTNLDNVNVGWFKRNKRKIGIVASVATLLISGNWLLGYTKKGEPTNDGGKKEEQVKKTFNEEKYNIDPLAGDSMVKFANGWVDEFAKNGYDAKKNTEAMSIAAISTTFGTGAMGINEFKDKLALGANFTTESAVLKQLDTFRQVHQKVLHSKGKIDYSKVINNKASISMLTRLQKVYLNEDNLSFKQQQEEANKLVQECIDHKDEYDPFDLSLIGDYITMGSYGNYNREDLDLFSEETRKLFVTSMYDSCCQQLDNCAVDFDRINEKNQSIDQTSKTYLVSYYKDLILDTVHEHPEEGVEYYYSFNEINQKVLEHSKTVKVANIDVDKKAEQESIKKADQMGAQLGYPNLTDEERKIMQPNGTIPSGKHTVENKVGDKVNTGSTDVNGNKVQISLAERGKYKLQGYNDRQKEQKKTVSDFPSKEAYDAYIEGWNEQDRIMQNFNDVYEEKTETKDEMTNQNSSNNVKPQQPSQKPSQPSTQKPTQTTPSTPKPTQPSQTEKEEIVDETVDVKDEIYDVYLPGVNDGSIEIETPTTGGKTR